jgi:hypothetical protein
MGESLLTEAINLRTGCLSGCYDLVRRLIYRLAAIKEDCNFGIDEAAVSNSVSQMAASRRLSGLRHTTRFKAQGHRRTAIAEAQKEIVKDLKPGGDTVIVRCRRFLH